jgi:MFS family permease
MIALPPVRDLIRVAAPVLLVIARLIQALSVGGGYGASATYSSEMASGGGAGSSRPYDMSR